jgi:hypothetical protein
MADRMPWERPGSTVREAQSLADLQAKYDKAERDRVELERLRRTPIPEAPKPIAEREMEARRLTRANEIGSQSAKAEVNLPAVETSATDALRSLRELMGHPGFSAAVGMPDPFSGGFGPLGTIPGTDARGFANRLEQLKGGAFLQAFEALKNAGAISEVEGTKATAAKMRMDTSTSEEEFRAAAADFDSVIRNGLTVARAKARLGGLPYSKAQIDAELARRKAARGGK